MQSKFALLQGIMKTIYILGNGFDLAHGLKTSYMDFKSYLKKYHEDFLVKLEDLYGLQESIECCDPYINNDHKNSLAKEVLWQNFEDNLGKIDEGHIVSFGMSIGESIFLDGGSIGIKDTLDNYMKKYYSFIEEFF